MGISHIVHQSVVFNSVVAECEGDDAKIFDLDGQVLFPMMLANGYVSTASCFRIVSEKLPQVQFIGEISMIATDDEIRSIVKDGFDKFREGIKSCLTAKA